jgi:hypothetical protein
MNAHEHPTLGNHAGHDHTGHDMAPDPGHAGHDVGHDVAAQAKS